MKNLLKTLFSLFCLSVSLFIFSTCTIGLGKAVDIQAPTVNVTYPPLSSIVSKEFTLGGTWSDDVSLQKIQVDIYKLVDGNKSSTPDFSSSSVSIKDNKWYISVNKYDEDLYSSTNGWQLSDGSYEIHVIAYDNGGHESQDVVHTLSIDNSAPVLMITNPTTTGDDEEKEEFGQIIQFVGSFYDLCGKIKKMDISFYDNKGNHIWDTNFTNIISLSDSSPLVVARYYANEEDRQKNEKIYQNYLHLFGEDNLTDYENDLAVNDALIYFTVTAYDSAKKYSEENFLADNLEGDETEGNNKTTYFYRGTTSLQNLLAGETISDFNITEFAAFLNGNTSYEDSSTAKTIRDTAKESLSSSRDIENEDTAETITSKYLTFKFNPKNNPVYSVGGYDILSEITDDLIDSYTKEENNNNYYKNTYKNSSIPLSINVGNDNKAIWTHTVSIYRVDKNVYSGTISDDMFTGDTGKTNYQKGCFEPLWTWNKDVYEEFNSWGVDIQTIYTPTDTNKNIASISKSFTLSEFEAGHNYVIYVTGKDIAGNAIICGNTTGYGYCGTVSTQAATFSQTEGKTNNAIINKECFLGTDESNEFYVKGTISSETQVQSLTYTITVTNSENSTETRSKNGTLDILTEAPSPLPDSYCYTTSGSAIPLVYNYRFSGKTIAETFKDFVGTGTYDVNLTLTANNGVSVSWSRDFTLDTQDPVPELSELTLAAEDTDDDDNSFWWVNPKKALTIAGLVTDNKATAKTCVSWIKLVAMSDASTEVSSTASGDTYTSTTQTDVNKWTFTVPASTIKSTYYGAKLYIYSKDTAGNIGCITETLAFDTTAPKGLHALDGNNKDIYFRIGSYNNDDISSDNALWDNNLDTDVGGKYQENTYGNSTTIKIRGNFEEEESGLSMIYYKVVQSPTALEYDVLKTQAEDFYANYNSAAEYTGYFAPLSSDETKRVFYSALTGRNDGKIPLKYEDEDGNIQTSSTEYIVSSTDKVGSKYYTNIVSNFDSVISGFSASGTNYLILVAEDKVGNASLDKVVASGPSGDTIYYNASINVDQESPLLACSSHNGQEFTNGVSEISVSGTFEDLPDTSCAGVKDVSLTVNGESISATLTPVSTDDYSSGSWSAKIDAETVAAFTQGKTYNVNATVTDYAGNSSASTIFTLKFDTEAPVVSITTPSTSASLNGKMSLTGSVTYEDSAPVKLELYASKTAPSDGDLLTNTSKYTKIGTITDASKIYSWSFADIDTYTLTSVASAPTTAELYFVPVVTDTAGNTNTYNLTSKKNEFTKNTNYFKYTVDMDTDRPVVKVTNLSIIDGAYILKNGENAKLEGSISDDDTTSEKVVKTFIATTSQLTSTTNVTSTSDNSTGIVTSKLRVGTSTPAVYDITTFNPATGEWTFTPADTSDGSKTINFYIVDNEDTVFYTGKKNTVSTTDYYYASPYFQFKSSDKESNTAAISYKSDATAPVVSAQLQAYQDAAGTSAVGDQVSPSASVNAGGSEKGYVKFTITGSDANGIDGFRLTLNYTDEDGTEKQIKLTSKDDWATDGFYTMGNTNDDGTVWTTDTIALSEMQTGPITGSIDVYDKSGLLGTASIIFNVDNTAPTVTFTSPSSTEELTGDITFGGTSTDTGNAGTSTTAWLIPTAEQRAMDDDTLATESIWHSTLDANKSVSVWAFTLDSATLAAYDNTDYATSTVNAIYTLPFYIKTTDAFGNTKIDRTFTFKHNPNADRPKTEISYPNDKNYGTDTNGNPVNWVTLGGAIRISGSANIPSNTTTVDSVYLQLISGTDNIANNGTYTNTSTYAASKGLDVMTKAQIASATGKTLSFDDDFEWGIKADKTGAWDLTINEDGKLNPAEGKLTYIAIRACAINAVGKVGTWTPWYYINIDNTAPSQTASLYQFVTPPTANDVAASTTLATTNITASQEYGGSEIYLKGNWYLTVKLQDESELSSFNVSKIINGTSTSLSAGSDYYSSTKDTADSKVTQYLYIPVDKSSSSVDYSVVVKDSEHTITSTYSLFIDNTAPTLEYVYKGSSLSESRDNVLDEENDNTVTDSNYIYTLGGRVEETASGFERLAFYFVRDDAIDETTYTSEVILDPLITSGTADSKAVITNNLSARPFTQESDTFYLYSKEVAGKIGNDGLGYTFEPTTSSDITGNAHIRVGGLIEVGGLLRRITEIDSDGTITFNTSTGVKTKTSATAYFPYAQVVDNTSTESLDSQSANPFTFKNNSDDGDLLPETLTGSKSAGFSWDATIHSSNIPDGPCSLVVLAFDKAGNVSGKTYPIKVENSAPRLAKVFFGTDLNSSSDWQPNEFTGYDLYNANTTYGIATSGVKEKQSIATASYGSAFTIKDKLAVVAEIVGGNGTITMVYGRGATTTAAVGTGAGASATANATIGSLVTSGKIGTVSYNNASVSTSLKGFTLTNAQLVGTVAETNDGTGKQASFTFWDSTDELTPGVNSQNCVLQVRDFTIDLVDGTAPLVNVNNFYWASASENSLYSNSSANGHIELESDLTGTAALTAYGDDPKVSGKITFTGTAYDEHTLKTLKFKFGDFNEVTMATYTPASGWDATSGNSGTALSAGGKYEWTLYTDASGTEKTEGYYDDSYYLNQSGHKVYWTISVDTAQIGDVAALDQSLSVTASDQSSNDGNDSYQMDVVPYITKISTGLDKAYKNKPSVFNRSALGNYPVRRGEDITISGFNLKKGSTAPTVTIPVTDTSSTTLKSSSKTSIVATIPDTAKSGELEITVNTVSSLNNKTLKTVEYNQEPNGINNDILTNERKIKVWSFNTVVTDSGVRYPTMKVGKNTDQTIGFIYGSGADKLRMYNGTDYEIGSSWTQYYSTGIAVDNAGRLYGSAMNGDSGAQYADQGGTGDTNYANNHFYAWNTSTTGSTWTYNSSDYAKAIENAYNGTKFNSERIKGQKIVVTSGTRANSTGYVYMTYFDDSNNQLKFRYGTVSNNNNKPRFSTALANHDNKNNGSTTGFQVIAGTGCSGTSSITDELEDGTSTQQNIQRAGEYSAVGVIPTGVTGAGTVVIAWYDASNQRLLYSYNSEATDTSKAANWGTNTKVIDDDFAGWYVDMAVDPEGGIHIAYYGASNGDLKYAYLPTYTSNPQIVTVDSYLSVGTNISIEVPTGKETIYQSDGTLTTRYLPHISYYMSAFTKTSYSVRTAIPYKLDSDNNFIDGVTDDMFTGNWEVMTVPTNQIPLDYTIGIGIKKNASSNDSSILGYGTKTGLQTAVLQQK